jgi:flagellar assembly factor FliW
MEVETKSKGRVSVTEKQIITIPDGLFGFEKYKKYALIDSDYTPFIWLQSLDESGLAFLIIDPFSICSDYEADIDDESLKKIGITLPEDIVVMAIVTVPSDGGPVTANLQGPIVINRKNNRCMQVILSDSHWTTKYRIGV